MSFRRASNPQRIVRGDARALSNQETAALIPRYIFHGLPKYKH